MADEFTLTARWVFPVTTPPLEDGLVTVRGERIVAVEPRGTRTADIDLGNVAIVPGFVNAHTHLDLTGARGLTPPTADFVAWLRRVIAYRRARTPKQVADDVKQGIAESLRFGTTLIGDIAAEGATWDALAAASIRAVVFHELIGMSEERAATAWERFGWWLRGLQETETCRPGVSPHAPYSVAESLYARASNSGVPVAIHLAESRAEMDLLGERCGPFVAFLKDMNAWAPAGLMNGVERAMDLSTSTVPVLLVHCNYLPSDVPSYSYATIVFCPRTHAAFGHPDYPLRNYLARGIRVALGTDSLASNPDLSILSEARFVRSRFPDVPGDMLLYMATRNGAVALGWGDRCGGLGPCDFADFAVVALPNRDTTDPHELLFDSDLPVVATWFRGRRVWPAD